jgi:outer membrane protein assembly factor BamB
MYMANSDGTVECLDPRTGEQKWKERLSGGTPWGSIVAVGDNLYVTTQRGDTVVFKANPEKLEEIASNSLNEHSNSTIAVSDGQIFLRTYKALYCIGEK